MARITFRFDAALDFFLAPRRRGREFDADCAQRATLKHAIEALGVPHTEVGLLSVNGEPAGLQRLLRAGDRVEVGAPTDAAATGEDRELRFIADCHLGGLARLLRIAGFDTLYRNDFGDREIAEIAAREHRIVLTRDRELLKLRTVERGCYLRATGSRQQFVELAARLGLGRAVRPLTRCIECNDALQPVARSQVLERLPPRVRAGQQRFLRCAHCDRIYWEGSHGARMLAQLEAALRAAEPGAPAGNPEPGIAARCPAAIIAQTGRAAHAHRPDTSMNPASPTGAAERPLIEAGNPANDDRAFRRCLGQFPTGVSVVTARNGERLAGMAVNSFAAVSLNPPLVLWSIRRESGSAADFLEAGHYAVSVLADDQVGVSQRFGSGHPERFALSRWQAGLHGAPLIAGAIAHLECRLAQVIEGGDHWILLGEVLRYARYDGEPLLFTQGRYGIAQEYPSQEQAAAAPAPADQPGPGLLRGLIYAGQRLSLGFDSHRQALGLSASTARLINRLHEGGCDATALERATFLGRLDVEDALAQLLRLGLVSSEAGRFDLTASGRERHDALAQRAADYMAQEFDGIPEADLAAFRRVLERIGARAD